MGVRWAIAPPSGHASATLAAATGNRLGAASAPADFGGDPPRNPAARGRAGQLTCDPPRARYGYCQTPSAFGLPCLPVLRLLRPMAAATCPTTRGNRKLSGKRNDSCPFAGVSSWKLVLLHSSRAGCDQSATTPLWKRARGCAKATRRGDALCLVGRPDALSCVGGLVAAAVTKGHAGSLWPAGPAPAGG